MKKMLVILAIVALMGQVLAVEHKNVTIGKDSNGQISILGDGFRLRVNGTVEVINLGNGHELTFIEFNTTDYSQYRIYQLSGNVNGSIKVLEEI